MSSSSEAEAAVQSFTRFVLDTLDEKRAEDIVWLDIRELSDFADEFIIATVTSGPQASAVIDACEIERKARGLGVVGIEGDRASSWVVLDYGDFVVHLFTPDAREYYGLEHLWGDAPRLEP